MISDLQLAWDNACSFGDKNKPSDIRYIGKIIKEFVRGEREFLLYKDTNNQYWYESRWIKK